MDDPETVASAIRIGNPASWRFAETARDESGGVINSVTDDEILEAYRLLAQEEGIFCEPASAACVAGLLKHIQSNDVSEQRIVCVITGHGLKDPETALNIEAQSVEVDADAAAVEAAIGCIQEMNDAAAIFGLAAATIRNIREAFGDLMRVLLNRAPTRQSLSLALGWPLARLSQARAHCGTISEPGYRATPVTPTARGERRA